MSIRIIESAITAQELNDIAKERFGDLVKAVVDIERGIMAVGGELHADEEAMLLEQGSRQQDLWGINLYPEKTGADFIEFDSIINIRPSQGNRSRGVDDPAMHQRIIEVVRRLISE